MSVDLLFVCVRNRVRSPFSQFLFGKMLKEKANGLAERVKVSSAGFCPARLLDKVSQGAHQHS